MEEEDWFQATGPAAVGFNTHGANIKVGGSLTGREVGAACNGETGVIGNGGVVGVSASGSVYAVVGRGVNGGRGGRFESTPLTAQVQLDPDRMHEGGREVQEVVPRELLDAQLPRRGAAGDLYMAGGLDGEVPAGLWLCVASDERGRGAQWCQVLLGNMMEGQTSEP